MSYDHALGHVMKSAIFLVGLSFLFSGATPSLSSASGGNPPAASAAFSAADFDWREVVPYLYQASALPGEQGLKLILENSKVLRAYVAMDVRNECKPGNERCDSSRPDFTVDGEVLRRIDSIVKEGLSHQRRSSLVDYPFGRQEVEFSGIGALRSDQKQDAYLVLRFADHAYTAAQLQAKYGPPRDTNVYQSYSVFIYQVANSFYSSKAVFEVNPVDGAVIKVAISLKARKRH